jgi:hypothetical protein
MRGSPVRNVIEVSGGGGPAVSSTMAWASGITRTGLGPFGPSPEDRARPPPQAAAASQSQVAPPHQPRDIPVIEPRGSER